MKHSRGLVNSPTKLANEVVENVRASGLAISKFAKSDENFQLTISRGSGEQISATVPAFAIQQFAELLTELADSGRTAKQANQSELSTIQAAEQMRVSRPYLIKLLDSSKIPFRLVGAHRRIRQVDLLAYIEIEKQKRNETLKALIAEQEQLGLYE